MEGTMAKTPVAEKIKATLFGKEHSIAVIRSTDEALSEGIEPTLQEQTALENGGSIYYIQEINGNGNLPVGERVVYDPRQPVLETAIL